MRRLPLFYHPFADRLILWRPVDWFNISLEHANILSIFTEGTTSTKPGQSENPAVQGLDTSNLNPPTAKTMSKPVSSARLVAS
jgi:hypothetical protein